MYVYFVVILLLAGAGLFSGLNLGLMSLEPNELKRKAKLGDKQAKKVYPLRAKGNQLLVTLLVGNVAFNSTLAIFLNSLTAGVVAAIISTILITIFAEILPQSVVSRYALSVGASTAWFIRFVMFVLTPVCKPVAWVLDKFLGQELPEVYSRKELIQILEEHGRSTASDIKQDEERIASGALSFGTKKVKEVMTPRSVVVGLTANQIVDKDALNSLVGHGYSRMPVIDEAHEKVIGILYAFNLVKGDFLGKRADEICTKKMHYMHEEEVLDKALNAFIRTKQHLFVVINEFAEYTGVVAIEDILEEILGLEIVDEFDEFSDMRKVAKRLARQHSA